LGGKGLFLASLSPPEKWETIGLFLLHQTIGRSAYSGGAISTKIITSKLPTNPFLFDHYAEKTVRMLRRAQHERGKIFNRVRITFSKLAFRQKFIRVLREPQHERYFSQNFNTSAVRAGALEGSKD
jgi:hypothetical protein